MNEKSKSDITHQKLTSKLPDVIKISQCGMDERSIQRISTMFTIIFKGRCKLVVPEEAMVALIDVNEDSVSTNIQESCQEDYPGLPAIVLVKTSADKAQNNVRYLEKPLKREEFWKAIVELFERSEQLKSVSRSQLDKAAKARTSNSAAALDSKIKKDKKGPKIAQLAKNKANDSIYFKPKNYLLCYVQNLLAEKHPENCALRIEFAYKYRIILYLDQKMALTNLSDSDFRTIAIMQFSDKQMHKLKVEKNASLDEKLSSAKGEFSPMTIDALLWTLALRTSRGRLPKGTSVNKEMYLHAWPNLPRLCNTPHAMRIASLWIDNPSSLNELAALLGIDSENVYSFYTAANTLGLVGRTKRQSDNIIETQPVVKNKKRGLFGAILRRLKRK